MITKEEYEAALYKVEEYHTEMRRKIDLWERDKDIIYPIRNKTLVEIKPSIRLINALKKYVPENRDRRGEPIDVTNIPLNTFVQIVSYEGLRRCINIGQHSILELQEILELGQLSLSHRLGSNDDNIDKILERIK
jgi:hypothetical protein